MFDLEKDLPDELMGGSWAEQPGVTGPKPPAQGPGPGGQMVQQQLNGDDPTAAMHRQINNHLIQQVSIWDWWVKHIFVVLIEWLDKINILNLQIACCLCQNKICLQILKKSFFLLLLISVE